MLTHSAISRFLLISGLIVCDIKGPKLGNLEPKIVKHGSEDLQGLSDNILLVMLIHLPFKDLCSLTLKRRITLPQK